MNITVMVSAPVYPTEIGDKVRAAVSCIFPLDLAIRDFGIPQLCGEGNLESLRKFHMLVRDSRILDTARHILLEGMEGNTTQFCINKQVAFTGKVNFPAGDEALGSIYVEISAPGAGDLMTIIDWLAPETADGKPVREIDL